ncbi:MAG: transpeptidase family protein [Deltaproteobacteria bacterium]|nr:transpeptidase family protein [Deltaproteobacteria bacterium]
MKLKEKKWIRFRIHLVSVFFIGGLLVIFGRVYQLQVLQQEYLRGIAENGIIGTTKLPPKRGVIYDREGHELAISVQVGSVFAHPKQIKDKNKTARVLSKILGEKQSDILKRLKRNRSFVWIKRRIPQALTEKVETLHLKGLGVTTETRRYYPGRETAAHVIGFAGTDNQGLEGLERKFDGLLRGPEEKLAFMRDALGRPFAVTRPVTSNTTIHNLYLTIDKDIQYKAQQALREAVGKAKAKGGNCVVVEPYTGEILAMAVVPEFNPNIFFNYKPYQWRNRAVTDCFEPGSTIKAFLLSAALEESAVSPLTQFYCEQGKFKVGGSVVHDTHKYGNLSVADIVVYSSNIGAIKLGRKLGYRKFTHYLRNFGFGKKTEIDLMGERGGFIRDAKNAREIDQATLYFGQGMTCTSLQLAMAMAAIANGGKLMRPYVVSKIVDESGNTTAETVPKVVGRAISARTARRVTSILEGVATDEGTAEKAAIEGYRVAGKTGTSQKVDPETKGYSKSKYVASFVGFIPSEKPRLVILVMIDEPKGHIYGGLVAGPVFKEVGSWALNHLRISPNPSMLSDIQVQSAQAQVVPEKASATDVSSRPAPEPIDPVQAGQLPDFTGLGMREVLKRSRALGLKVCLEGSGLAIRQNPVAGSPLKTVQSLKVNFKPPM